VCLLAVLFRVRDDLPLVVAANRDEFHARAATPFGVLEPGPPRVLGGRDAVAGGTWLTVSRTGLVVGLTNRPRPGRDPARRSRGELPLLAAGAPDAGAAVARLTDRVRTEDYNPCWLLVADRAALFSVEVHGAGPPEVARLDPGIHALENAPLEPPSPKAARTVAALEGAAAWPRAELAGRLAEVLRSHDLPDEAEGGRPRPLSARCVHAGPYGTRSATIVLVPAGSDAPPTVLAADGPPCATELEDRTLLWTAATTPA